MIRRRRILPGTPSIALVMFVRALTIRRVPAQLFQ
jgi:hypothetical protein